MVFYEYLGHRPNSTFWSKKKKKKKKLLALKEIQICLHKTCIREPKKKGATSDGDDELSDKHSCKYDCHGGPSAFQLKPCISCNYINRH